MAFELCMVLGFPHPDFLLGSLSASQWRDWIEYAAVCPVGEDRNDWRSAFATATLASCWAEGVDVVDCKIDWLKSKRGIVTAQQVEMLTEALNARFKAKEKVGCG